MGGFRGVYTALVTPFNDNGSGVDEKSLHTLIERQVNAGVHGIIFGGSTGEGQTLEDDELKTLFTIAKRYQKHIQVLGACGSSSTAHTLIKLKRLQELEVSGVLVSTPPYNKAPQRGLLEYYSQIADNSTVPLMIYNIPGRTAVNLTPETISQIWKLKNVASLKESSGNWEQICRIARDVPKQQSLLSGDDPFNIAVWSVGGLGTVSVLSNVIPSAVAKMWKTWVEGKTEEAKRIHESTLLFTQNLFVESNPVPVKWVMGQILKKELKLRSPMVTLASQYHDELKKHLAEMRQLDYLRDA